MAENSASVLSTMETISSARFRKSTPSAVSETPWLLRTSSVCPSVSSKSRIWRDRVGWVKCRKLAAPAIFPSRATAKKYRKTRISMICLSPFPQYIAHSYACKA